MSVQPNAIDLTDLQAVKGWANVSSATDDDLIQGAITAFSQYVLNLTGRDTLKAVKSFTEVYDGNGSARLFLRNSPIITVTSVTVGATPLPISTGFNVGGVFIDQSGRSIAIRCGGNGGVYSANAYPGGGLRFAKGIGNIQVLYNAGYTQLPFDLEMACRKTVGAYYKRRAWSDQKSKSLSAGGGGSATTTYRDWNIAPEDEVVILNYRRFARV